MATRNLGKRAADADLSGGGYEPGPGRSAMQYIPESPRALEGFFIINPPDFIAYRELYDEHGPEGLKSRPVEEDFVTSGEQKVSDRVLTPFYLSKAITNIASGDGREVNKVVALKIPKSLHNDLVAQFEITGGQPLLNHPMRLTKSGKGLNTRYTFVVMGFVDNSAKAEVAARELKLRDGRQVGVQAQVADWLLDVLEMDYDNLHPANPENVKAAAARFAKKDSAPQGQTQTVPTGIQQPAIDIPTDSGVGAPFTVDQLMAMPLKDLRALALQHSVVSSEMKPDEFKANLQGIATALANTLLQKAA